MVELNRDELNNKGDYISGAVGDDGKDVVVGKNITTTRTDDNRRNESSNNFNFQNSDSSAQLLQLFMAINNVQNGLFEFRSEQRQTIGAISDKLDTNNRRMSILEVRFDDQQKTVEELKQSGSKRDETLSAIQARFNAPALIVASESGLTRWQFWLLLVGGLVFMVFAAELGLYLMRGLH